MTLTIKRNLIWMCIEVLTIGEMCCLDILVINFDQITYSYSHHREKAKSYETLLHTWRICTELRENII